MTTTRPDVATSARLVAEDLFAAAGAIEAADVVPAEWLDRLAAAGLYGLFGPADLGGADADADVAGEVIEALAGASLTTTLVWIQHHSVVRALRGARPALRDRWLAGLVSGEVRAGIAYAALRRPGPPVMVARPGPGEGGWTLDGSAPWVSGWDRIDVLYTGAIAGDDLVWSLVDPHAPSGLATRPLHLSAVQASSTVGLEVTGLVVDADSVVDVEPVAAWRARDQRGLRTNGHLAVGVAERCARLLDSPQALRAVDDVRRRLRTATSLAPVRAEASRLAVEAASALVASLGGRASDWDSDAARLARDATFLLVFGQTAAVRAEQQRLLLG